MENLEKKKTKPKENQGFKRGRLRIIASKIQANIHLINSGTRRDLGRDILKEIVFDNMILRAEIRGQQEKIYERLIDWLRGTNFIIGFAQEAASEQGYNPLIAICKSVSEAVEKQKPSQNTETVFIKPTEEKVSYSD